MTVGSKLLKPLAGGAEDMAAETTDELVLGDDSDGDDTCSPPRLRFKLSRLLFSLTFILLFRSSSLGLAPPLGFACRGEEVLRREDGLRGESLALDPSFGFLG